MESAKAHAVTSVPGRAHVAPILGRSCVRVLEARRGNRRKGQGFAWDVWFAKAQLSEPLVHIAHDHKVATNPIFFLGRLVPLALGALLRAHVLLCWLALAFGSQEEPPFELYDVKSQRVQAMNPYSSVDLDSGGRLIWGLGFRV